MYRHALATAALIACCGVTVGCSSRDDVAAVAPAAEIAATSEQQPPATLAGLEQYCRDQADNSALLARYNLKLEHTMAEHRFEPAAADGWPVSLRVQEQHGQIQGIWLDWGVRGGMSRSEMAQFLALPLLATAPGTSDEADYKTVYQWQAPTPRTASISLTCGGDGERGRCYKLYFECVEYYE